MWKNWGWVEEIEQIVGDAYGVGLVFEWWKGSVLGAGWYWRCDGLPTFSGVGLFSRLAEGPVSLPPTAAG